MLNDVVAEVARQILSVPHDTVLKVAVDGVDGVGKTTFADHLGKALQVVGRSVIRASVDGFHNPRETRYRLGKESPEGFYRDSYDYAGFKTHLLEPLSSGGSLIYKTAIFDHRTNHAVEKTPHIAAEDAILIVDGIFLQRIELRQFWNVIVFLDAPFDVTVPRGASRGPDSGSPDPKAASNRRYVEGQTLYLTEATPRERADIMIDNSDLAAPVILRRLSVAAGNTG